jgi:hypothetical protein
MATVIQVSTVSKWSVEESVLSDEVSSWPGRVGLGGLLFPNMATAPSASSRPTSACVNLAAMIPVGMLGTGSSRQRAMLTRSLSLTQPNPQGGAPTLDAYLAGLDELGRAPFDGARQMLLITDGQPTFAEGCVGTGTIDSPVDPGPIVSAISAARRAGVRTFVIGSPGSQRTNSRGDDARPWLSYAAEAGGTAQEPCSDNGPNYCHYDMTRDTDFSRDLRGAFSDIARRILHCDVPLPDPPQNQRLDFDRVNVVFTSSDGASTILLRDDSPSCSLGWRYSSDRQSIVLCGDACTAVNAELGAKLEFVFGCGTVTP